MTRSPIEIDRILCPTDFSVFSSRALRHAIAMAQRFEARLTVLHVIPPVLSYGGVPPYSPALAVVSPPLREQIEGELRAFVEPALAARVPTQIDIREGDPWREIERVAGELPADLVVMGTHGRKGLSHLVLGSVTEKVMHRVPCPVLAVGAGQTEPPEAPPYRRILCPTKLMPASQLAVDFALALAAQSDAAVELLHVIESMPSGADGADPFEGAPEFAALRERMVAEADAELRRSIPPGLGNW